MPDFLANIVAGALGALFLAGVFSFLSGYGAKGFGTALLLVFAGSLLTGQGYMAFGVLIVIVVITLGFAAKTYLNEK